MIPPTSIDGTDITGATIDGTDVQGITVDGDVVFSAGPNFPVAYSNLIAWYPFDSAEYGGSNGDDVTAILGGSGDDTAYDGTVVGANYVSSGGVTDIRAGANSGAYDFPNNTDSIDVTLGTSISSSQWTLMAWVEKNLGGLDIFLTAQGIGRLELLHVPGGDFRFLHFPDNQDLLQIDGPTPSGTNHLAVTLNNGSVTMYINGSDVATGTTSGSVTTVDEWGIGNRPPSNGSGQDDSAGGIVDDARLYTSELSASQINQIYQNTQP